jgi:hypothetical protein
MASSRRCSHFRDATAIAGYGENHRKDPNGLKMIKQRLELIINDSSDFKFPFSDPK